MHTIETTILLGICFLCLVLLLQENIQLHERIREKAQVAYQKEVDSHSLEKSKDYFKVELYTRLFSVVEDLTLRKKGEIGNADADSEKDKNSKNTENDAIGEE